MSPLALAITPRQRYLHGDPCGLAVSAMAHGLMRDRRELPRLSAKRVVNALSNMAMYPGHSTRATKARESELPAMSESLALMLLARQHRMGRT